MKSRYAKFNEPWMDSDVSELKAMAERGETLESISAQLGRTPNAIRLKLIALGLLEKKPAARAWSPEDDSALVASYEAGEEFEEMAERFGRSVRAVVARLVHLRISLFAYAG